MMSNNSRISWRPLIIAMLALLLMPGMARAQYFTTTGKGDLLAGFRKVPPHAGTYEMVVDLGNITNYIALPVGTTTNIAAYNSNQLAFAFAGGLGFLNWSAFSTVKPIGLPEGPWVTPVGSFPKASCWYTQPRTNASVQTVPPVRYSYNQQGNLRSEMLSAGTDAANISSSIGTTNADNNTNLVVESVATYSTFTLSETIGDPVTDIGDFRGTCFDYTVENETPSTFSSPQVSDLYQSCSTGFPDPLSSQTNGNCYYLGYFTLNTDGTMSFTRQANSTTPPPPPPQPSLSITQNGLTNIISFGTTNGATYTLHYTTISGLTTPRSTWPTLGSPIVGTGGITNFTDTAASSGRVYTISAHN
jgi:hypothetical protein